MRKLNSTLILLLAMPVLLISAQTNELSEAAPAKNKKASKKMSKEAALAQIDLSIEPVAEPSDELDVTELQLQRLDLDGKVIELTFDRVIFLKPTDQGYVAKLTFGQGRERESAPVLIPKDGLELFQEMAERDLRSPRRETVYVEVIDSKIMRAVGTDFSKNKPEGERYSW